MAGAEVAVPFLFILLVLAVVVGAVIVQKRRNERLAADLQAAGVQITRFPGAFSALVRGTLDGRDVSVEHVNHGKNGPWTTVVTVACTTPAGWRLKVTREHAGNRIAKAFGAQDVEVGDEAFDRAYRVVTPDEHRGTFTLGDAVRGELLAVSPKRVEARDGRIVVEVDGRVTDAGVIVERMRFARRLAERVEATV